MEIKYLLNISSCSTDRDRRRFLQSIQLSAHRISRMTILSAEVPSDKR